MPTNDKIIDERLLAAKRHVFGNGKRVFEILARCEAEGRDLSRREAGELKAIQRETDELRASMGAAGTFDPRMAQGTRRLGEDALEQSDVLAPTESVRSWLAERGQLPVGGIDEPDRLSLGKMVRGAVTGRWEGAEHEQRALSESVLGDGGFLLGPALTSTVIDRVRAAMQVMRAGARTVPLQTQTTYMAGWRAGRPRSAGTPSRAW